VHQIARRVKSSIAAQLLTVFALATLIPLGLVVVQIQVDAAAAEEHVFQEVGAVAQIASSEVTNVLDNVRRVADSVSGVPPFWTDDDDAIRDNVLAINVRRYPALATLGFVSQDYRHRGASDPTLSQARRTLSVGPYKPATVGSTGLGEEVASEISPSGYVLHVAVPVNQRGDSGRGFLGATLKLDVLPDTSRLLSSSDGTRALLVHASDGRILAELGAPQQQLGSIAPEDLAQVHAGIRAFRSAAAGDRLLSWSPVTGTPWLALVEAPRTAALDAISAQARVRLAVHVGISAAGVGLLLLLGRRLARRIRLLEDAAAQWANRDWSHRAHVGGTDELGRLGAAFDSMARHVEESSAALDASVEQLEIAVVRANEMAVVAEEQARETRAIMDSVADAIITFESDGVVTSANPAAGRLFDCPPDTLRGRHVEGLIADVLPSTAADKAASLGTTRELVAMRADASTLPIDVTLTEMHDVERRFIAVARDISDRKETERQQLALERAEKLRALGQMASGMAHDLNQSLMLIGSYSELSRQALSQPELDVADLQEMYAIIARAARDGGETVKRMLLFSRGATETDVGRVRVGSLVREVAQLTAPRWRDDAQAEGRPISLYVEADDELAILGSPSALREALTNLILNAVDAMPRGGTVRLRVARVGDRVRVEVSDTGSGMSPEVQARIFEPFYTTKGEKGTGLGLAMVFGVVEQHHGEIRVHSAPGEGTRFELNFPADSSGARLEPASPDSSGARLEAAAFDVPKTSAAAAPDRGLRVLAVDDEPSIARAVVRILRPHGHTVVAVTSAEAALEKLASETFDVLVSDVGLGAGLNGWDLVEQVRRRWPSTRCVLATGWGASIDPVEARGKGVEAVLAKPYEPAELQRLLAA